MLWAKLPAVQERFLFLIRLYPPFSLFQQREERRYVIDDEAAVEVTSLDKLPKLFSVCRCWIIQYPSRVR
jgi:hypothetical protein